MSRARIQKRLIRGWLVFAAFSHLPEMRASSAFEAVVAPIFQARCASCHGAEKQKGRLALHTWERVAQGGDSGPLWVAGKPDESELVRRLKLPLDDEEHMPPSDEAQLTPQEVALLVRWIETGAAKDKALAELKLSPELARAAAELPEKLRATEATAAAKDPVWGLDARAVEGSRAALAKVVADLQQRFPGALSYESRTSAALHFTAAGLGRGFGDEELALLTPLAGALVRLDVSGTSITDKSARVLAGLKELRVLRLNHTSVTEATLAELSALAKLEAIALHESGVTPTAVGALAKLPGLRRVHVANGALATAARQAGLPVVETGSAALDVALPVEEKPTVAPAPKSE